MTRDERPTDREPARAGAGHLVASTLLALSAALTGARSLAQSITFDFAIGSGGSVGDLVLAATFWLHGAVLAGGAMLLRPRNGRAAWVSNYLAFLAGQGICSSLLWAGSLERAWLGSGRLLAAIPFLPALTIAAWIAGPVVAFVALFRVRAGGVVFAGQLVPGFLVAWLTVTGQVTA